MHNYSSPPLTRTPKGNEKLFELARVRVNEVRVNQPGTQALTFARQAGVGVRSDFVSRVNN